MFETKLDLVSERYHYAKRLETHGDNTTKNKTRACDQIAETCKGDFNNKRMHLLTAKEI